MKQIIMKNYLYKYHLTRKVDTIENLKQGHLSKFVWMSKCLPSLNGRKGRFRFNIQLT